MVRDATALHAAQPIPVPPSRCLHRSRCRLTAPPRPRRLAVVATARRHRRSSAAAFTARNGLTLGTGRIVVQLPPPAEAFTPGRTGLDDGETQTICGMPVTTPARTALDLACRYPPGKAVAAIDALARATDLKPADVELLAERYKGRRGIRRARLALSLVDAGAESPRETWLRLLLLRAGFPRLRPRSLSTTHTASWSRCSTWVGRTIKLARRIRGRSPPHRPTAVQQRHRA